MWMQSTSILPGKRGDALEAALIYELDDLLAARHRAPFLGIS